MIRIILISLFYLLSNDFINAQNRIFAYNNPKSKDWIIVWGGKPSSKFGAIFMKKEMNNNLLKNNVIYCDYEYSFEQINIELSKKYSNYNINGACGFSMGGVNAFNQIGKIPFIGLIDPLIPYDYLTNMDFKNVIMIFNLDVWDNKNRIRLKKISSILKDNSKELKIIHSEMPRIFSEKYMSYFKN